MTITSTGPALRTAALTLVLVLLVGASPSHAQPPEVVSIDVLSGRADLVTGGDALVEITLPEGATAEDLTVDDDGRDVTEAFALRPGGRIMGLVTGLDVGDNLLTARLPDGRGAHLTLTNAPVGGPVFAGPQVRPWLCETEAAGMGPAQDEQCNAPSVVELFYRDATTGQTQPYDPDNPPPDDQIATTTTDQGETVPHIIRRERRTADRGIIDLVVLYDPDQPWEPWAPQPAWNGKLYYIFEGGMAPNHRQGSTPTAMMDDPAVGLGFAVASGTLTILGQQTNSVVSAETVLMLKEHVIETLGEIRYTISTGCSGGSVQQHLVAETYPGLLDGIIPMCSFADLYTPVGAFAAECGLLDRYFNTTSPHLWAAEPQRAAVAGHASNSSCASISLATGLDGTGWDPTIGCAGGTTNPEGLTPEPEYVYDPVTNPEGVRCTIHDYQVAIFGRRPPDRWGPVEQQTGVGFANRPYDNVGVQYGLEALEAGTILTEQFLDLNEQIGGWDIDYGHQPERSSADPLALQRVHRSGQIVYGRQLARVPILDLRGSSNNEFHSNHQTFTTRDRLLRANGHADNQIRWIGPVPLADPEARIDQALLVMDEWLTNIESDPSQAPLEDKVLTNKPEAAVDGCFVAEQFVADQQMCETVYPHYGDPRIAAGGPLSNDVVKCQLAPLDRSGYATAFTDAEWARMEATFPDGVCDWSLPGVDQQPGVPWLTYADGSGGRPLGPAPASVPFGPGAAQVQREAGTDRAATAAAVSAGTFESATIVVVATAGAHPDALAGAPLAVSLDAPLLLTAPDALPAVTTAEIQRLGAAHAVVLGGEAAVGAEVVEQLRAQGLTVRRVAGGDRFATAAAIAGQLRPEGGGEVYVVRGDDFPDAVSAAGVAASRTAPVVLTGRDHLPAASAAVIAGADRVVVVGGSAAVSEAVQAEASHLADDVTRVGGATRYATSAALGQQALAAGSSPARTWIATGADFADALVAGTAAGRSRSLLLVDGQDLSGSPETANLLAGRAGEVADLRIVGGTSAVSSATHAALLDLLQ